MSKKYICVFLLAAPAPTPTPPRKPATPSPTPETYLFYQFFLKNDFKFFTIQPAAATTAVEGSTIAKVPVGTGAV